jgi:DNA-binding transcriptional LysR family regulator
VDLGITYLNSPPETIAHYPLFTTRSLLIAPKNHSFFTGKDPTLEQISRCPLILFSRTGEVEPYIADRFAQEQLKPNVVCTQTSIVSVKKYIELGLGATISVGNVISAGDEDKFEIIYLDKYFKDRTYYLFLRRKKYRSPAVNAFIRAIKPDIVF